MAAHKAGPPACNGKRSLPSPSYLPLAAFDDAALAADVRLLQAVQDAALLARRGSGGGDAGPPTASPAAPTDGRPSVRLRRLEGEARRRGVTLRLQTAGMSRRVRNSTRYDRRSRAMAWHVEWRVMRVKKGGEGSHPPTLLHAFDSRAVPEGDTLAAVLGRDLLRSEPAGADDAATRLAAYVAELEAGTLALRLAAAGRTSLTQPAFFMLDPATTLGAALKGRIVDEFPTIAVLLSADAGAL